MEIALWPFMHNLWLGDAVQSYCSSLTFVFHSLFQPQAIDLSYPAKCSHLMEH